MAFSEDARLLDALEIIAAFSENCSQTIDAVFCSNLVFNSRR